jgi:hypothetical protein
MQSNTEFQSRLPIYQAKRSKDFPKFLMVMCGHADCPGTKAGRPFLVAEREWLRPQRLERVKNGKMITIIGRSCPYCFRTGRLPKRNEIG